MPYTINDKSLLECELISPSTGAWIAEVTTTDALEIGDAAVIVLGSAEWRGTVTHSGADGARFRGAVIAGAGALSATLSPRQWFGAATLLELAAAACAALGEACSAASDRTLADVWHPGGPLGGLLDVLAARTGTTWRSRPDGSVAYDSAAVLPSGTELRREPGGGTVHRVTDATAEGGGGVAVEYQLAHDGDMLCMVRPDVANRSAKPPGAIIAGVLKGIDGAYALLDCGTYGSVKAWLWHGVAGVTATYEPGTPMLALRVSPDRTIAIAAPDGSAAPSSITINAAEIILGDRALKGQLVRYMDPVTVGTETGPITPGNPPGLLPPVFS